MVSSIKFICNDELIEVNLHPATTLLDFLRNIKRLTGTKEGCREGDCGACTVLIGELTGNIVTYNTVNSCLLPIGDVFGKHIVTIEGLNINTLTDFQRNMIEEGGTQCGFCTPGFIVSFTGYLLLADYFEKKSAVEALSGNLCRCTGHYGIIRAVNKTIDFIKEKSANSTVNRIDFLCANDFLPEYFKKIPFRLRGIRKEIKNKLSLKPKDNLLISGGTDLFVQKSESITDGNVNLFFDLQQGGKIQVEDDTCFINANATVSELESSSLISGMFPEFKRIAKLFGSPQIRNRATVGGNINNASPIGDMTIFLLSLNSKVFLSDSVNIREVFLKDYFLGYKALNKNPDEYVTKISFQIPPANYKLSFEKVCRRTYLDIASVNTSFYTELKGNILVNVRISAGGVAPIPLFLKETSEFLCGKEVKSEIIKEATLIAQKEISPISDSRGSEDYKILLLRQLLLAHFIKLFPVNIKSENPQNV